MFSQVFSVKYSEILTHLYLMTLLARYFCQYFQTWLIILDAQAHAQSHLSGAVKKCLKVIDLKSGTKCLQHWTASQPWLNIFGCDSLTWVCLDCDCEMKTIQSLSSNSSVTEIGLWQDHPICLTPQFLDFYIALHIAGKEYMKMGVFFKGNWWLVQLYQGKVWEEHAQNSTDLILMGKKWGFPLQSLCRYRGLEEEEGRAVQGFRYTQRTPCTGLVMRNKEVSAEILWALPCRR